MVAAGQATFNAGANPHWVGDLASRSRAVLARLITGQAGADAREPLNDGDGRN